MIAPLLALSVRQPWAWAITSPAFAELRKDIENRTWSTRHRGPTTIHASAGVRASDVADFLAHVALKPELYARLQEIGGLDLDALKARSGGIVGRVDIVDCVHKSASPWFAGPVGFVLADAEEVEFRPCRGQLGFFNPDRVAASPAEPPAMRDLFAA